MLEEAIKSYNFETALSTINNGEKFPSDIDKTRRRNIYNILIEEKQFEILDLLAQKNIIETDIYEYDSFQYSFFDCFFLNREIDEEAHSFFDEFIKHFSNINDEIDNHNLISFALTRGANVTNINSLLANGADVNFKNNEDENLIQQIIKSDEGNYGYSNEYYQALTHTYINFLINAGVEVDAPNNEQETALMSALRLSKTYFLDLLLTNGANPNHADNENRNAFYYAIYWAKDINAFLKMAEFATPELNELDSLGQSILFNYVSKLNFDGEETNQKIITQLIADGADLYLTCNDSGEQKTSLDAVAGRPFDIFKIVLATDAVDLDAQDSQGNTLLHKVCAYNINSDADKAKDTYRKVKLLLENGADFSITNDEDKTALMLASDDNYKAKTVELLMKQS